MQLRPSCRTPRTEADEVSRSVYPPAVLNAGLNDPGGDELGSLAVAAGPSSDEEGADGTLDEVARREREDMRPRLRDELGREPTEDELDEWLRRHTEGY